MTTWMRSLPRRGMRLALLLVFGMIIAGCGGNADKAAQSNPSPLPASADGTLTTVRPQVEWRADSADEWAAVPQVQTVAQGAIVRTDAAGRALLTLYSGVEVDILPGSELAIDSLVPAESGPPSITLTQLRGETLHRVGEVADVENGYVVNTPVASMVVRGTVFGVVVAEDGATRVTVQEGSVQAAIGAQTYTIVPGQQLEVTAGGTTAGPELLRLSEPTPNPTPSVAAIQAPGG